MRNLMKYEEKKRDVLIYIWGKMDSSLKIYKNKGINIGA